MAESYFEKRKRELGITGGAAPGSSPSPSYFEQRKMELGLVPDTRPKPKGPDAGTADRQEIRYQESKDYFETFPEAPEEAKPGRNLPVIGPIYRALDSFAGSPVQKTIQDVGLSLYTPGAGAANIAGLFGGVGSAISKVAPGLGSSLGGKVAKGAIQAGVTEAPVAMGNALNSQTNDLSEAAEQGLYGGLMGAGLGAAGPLVGRGIQNLRSARQMPEVLPAQETLALPPAQRYESARARSQGTVLPTNDAPIYGQGDVHTFELPEPTIPGTIRNIQEEVGQRITPPYENPTELARYVQTNMGDISLNEVRKLNYDELSQLADDIYRGYNPDQLASNVARQRGMDWNELQQGRMVTGSAATPVDTVGFKSQMPKLQATKQAVQTTQPGVEVIAPQRKFATEPKLNAQLNVAQLPRRTEMPVQPLKAAPQERGFVSTLKASEKAPQGLKERLTAAYKPVTNQRSVDLANKRLNKDMEAAASYVMGKSQFSAEKVTTAHRLIDEFSKSGNFERAVDIAEKIAEEGTRAGQTIQAFSIYNRLTPEGILVHATRVAKKTNEALPVGVKEVEVTPDLAAKLADLAQTTKAMTGVKELGNDVIDILERAKAGTTLTREETDKLKKFVEESRQFVKEVEKKPRTPKPPTPPKDKRVRDNVVSFLDAQEQAAKDRLRAKGFRISSTPLDIYADYAIIGAAKMARGTIKFSEWSEQMLKELGEDIRPHLENLYEKAKETFDLSTKRVSKTAMTQAERISEKVIRDKKLTDNEADSLRKLVEKVNNLSGDAKMLASQDLQAALQTLERPTFLSKVSTTQTIGQLLNPKTQVRNALGNELFYRLERLNKLTATPIDWARVKLFGGQRSVTFRTHNQGQYWRNFLRGAKAGWRGVNVEGLQTQFDIGAPKFSGKWNPMTYLEKTLGAALKSFDTAAYMRAVNNTIGEMATLRAINEGQGANKELIQKYIREADENMLKIADEYGRYVTFQDNNGISVGLQKLKRGLNFNKDFGVGDLVLKYPKTPGALVMRAIEYSPAGFLRSASIASRPWFKKDPNTAEAMQAFSRAMIGTFGLTGFGYFVMDQGIVTGSASKDKDIRDLQRSAGQGQYQVNLSALKRWVKSGFDTEAAKLKEGDSMYTYDWMQPVSIAISMGANIKKNMTDEKKPLSGTLGAAYNSAEGGLNTLVEQSVLQGLKRAAEGYPGQTVMDKVMDILSDVPASFVPTAFNQTKQLGDNAQRETYDPNKLQQSLNKAKAKIPGQAGELPQRYDTLGKPKEQYQENSIFNVLLNPGFSSRYELTPEAKLIVDLIAETGNEALAPRVPSKSITVKNPDGTSSSQKLTTQQFTRIQQLQGEETAKQLQRVNPGLSSSAKSKRVEDGLKAAGDKARTQLKKEMGVK